MTVKNIPRQSLSLKNTFLNSISVVVPGEFGRMIVHVLNVDVQYGRGGPAALVRGRQLQRVRERRPQRPQQQKIA